MASSEAVTQLTLQSFCSILLVLMSDSDIQTVWPCVIAAFCQHMKDIAPEAQTLSSPNMELAHVVCALAGMLIGVVITIAVQSRFAVLPYSSFMEKDRSLVL